MYLSTLLGTKTSKIIAFFTIAAVIISLFPAAVFAEETATDETNQSETPQNVANRQIIDGNHLEVRICHSAGQSGNFTTNTVDENSIDSVNGHSTHGNDIIPPFIGFAGLNWDVAGQATWNNNCVVPVNDEEATTTPEQVCQDDGALNYNKVGTCEYEDTDLESEPVINTCLVPNTLGDSSEFSLNNSGEKTVGQMLSEHGYSAIDTNDDQMNYQVWNLVDSSAESVTFTMRVLGKRAGNTQIVGYYKAGDTLTFTNVLTQSLDTDGESSVSVTIPATFANSFGFALKSDDKTWFSETAINTDNKDHVAAYNPSANLYLLAFEDFNNLGDGDYNDIVIEISGVTCNQPLEYTISGYKFNDKNSDGNWDKESEDGISGWEINLDQEGASTTHMITDANGYYEFVVKKGSYQVTETNQKGWEQTATFGTNADGPICYINVGNDSQDKNQQIAKISEGYSCTFGNHQKEEIINTCLIPNSLGDEGSIILQNSGEKSVAAMLADHGYAAVNVVADQKNYQVWNLIDNTASSVTFSMRVLGKRAANTQIVGYYKAGDTVTFTPVLTQALDTDGEAVVSVTVPATFANSFGFAVQSDGKTWFSEKGLNSDTFDHIAAFNPAVNTYLLAFEDFTNLGDSDYNDIVVEISGVTCQKGDGGGNSGGNEEVIVNGGGGGGSGSRTKRTPTGQVLGASSSTPTGLVLGDATSTLPVGAPNTGAGGAATVAVILPSIVAILPDTLRRIK